MTEHDEIREEAIRRFAEGMRVPRAFLDTDEEDIRRVAEADRFRRHTMDVTFTRVNPELISLMTGYPVTTTDNEGATVNDQNEQQSLNEIWAEGAGTTEPGDAADDISIPTIQVGRGGVRFDSGSITSAAGWCAPSQTLYTPAPATWTSPAGSPGVTLVWHNGVHTTVTDHIAVEVNYSEFTSLQRRLMIARLEDLTAKIRTSLEDY